MAKNESNKPEDIKTEPAVETPTDKKNQPEQPPLETGGDTTPTEISAEEAAVLGDNDKAAVHDIGNNGLEPPEPVDIPMPTVPGDDVVVSFDKINEIISDKKAAKSQEVEQPPQEKKEQETPVKKAGRGGRPTKADKTEKEPKPQKSVKNEKQPRAAKATKQKQGAGIGSGGGSVGSTKVAEQPKPETPPPAPVQPPEPKEAPRSGEQEQIVYVDDGYTGTDLGRDGFQRLLSDIYAKKVNCVIVKDLSRLSRNYTDAGSLIDNLFMQIGPGYC